jgi:hypothetical protein
MAHRAFFQSFLPWPGLRFKPYRITPISVAREVKRGTLSEDFHVQARIAGMRNAAVNSNEISGIYFELRITTIRLLKREVGRTLSIREKLSVAPPVGNSLRIQIL